MAVLRVYEFVRPEQAVKFAAIAPAGFRILAAASALATDWPADVFITSGTDGTHSGPTDPHYTGEAYDFQCNQWPVDARDAFVRAVVERAEGHGETAIRVANGWGTTHFWGFVESPGQPNCHVHIQRKQGTTYP